MNVFEAAQKWNEQDLLERLPNGETEIFEFKSSKIVANVNNLKEKLSKAASAFWNSGGGIFIIGVTDDGEIDGGVPKKIKGDKGIADWLDQLINVKPLGKYQINLIESHGDDSKIGADNAVVVISFFEGVNPPHMAADHRYYIRAGRHSEPANHFLVETLQMRRNLSRPMLKPILKLSQQKVRIVELWITSLNSVPAVDIELSMQPLSGNFSKVVDHFPLTIPMISDDYPFSLELGIFSSVSLSLEPFELRLSYSDTFQRPYESKTQIDIQRMLKPFDFESSFDLHTSLRRIADDLSSIKDILSKK